MTMRFKLLGKSGLRVSELCLGTMTFGEDWGWGASKEESKKMFDAFAEAGGNYLDSSVNYTAGTSETFLGEFMQAERDRYVVATKYTLTFDGDPDPNNSGNGKKNMRRSVERSLKRLQTDYIDLLYLHMWDFMTPLEEVLRAADDLVRAGKVLYFAFSDTPAWIVAEACARAEMMGWTRPVAFQLPYSLTRRDAERAELPMAKYWDLTVMPFGALGGGLLTGKYAKGNTDPKRYELDDVPTRLIPVIEAVAAVAEETGRSRAQVALNWVRGQGVHAEIIPILGARTLAQLQDNLACLEWTLSDEQVKGLSDAAKLDYGFPLGWLSGTEDIVYGATLPLTDTHRPFPVRA
jgi:aryl-alcohol dehydrogenase-like predicted oxidoreductase